MPVVYAEGRPVIATLRERIRNLLGPRRSAELGHPNAGSIGFGRIIPGSDIDANPIGSKAEALEQYNGWVFAAASFIAEETRALEWNVWLQKGSRSDWTIDDKHPINDILKRPNASMAWGEFIELTDLHLSLNGEAYWHVITDPVPIGLEVIYPHWVTGPVIQGGRLTGWRVAKPGVGERTLPAEDVIRLHRPHPKAAFLAASVVEAAAVSHYFDLYLRAYGMTLFRNDAGIPAGLLSSDAELSADQAKFMREAWRQTYSQRRGDVVALGKGMKYQSLGIPMQDLKFLEVGQFTRDQVLSLFRVSPALLGVTGDSNRANMEAALWGFQRHTLRPRVARYEAAIRDRVMPRFMGDAANRYWFEFRDVVSQDRDRVARESDQMLARGAITVNEYRERMGLPTTPGGDVFLLPSGVSVASGFQPDAASSDDASVADEDQAFADRIARTDDLARELNRERDLGITWAHIITGGAAATAPGAYLQAAGAGAPSGNDAASSENDAASAGDEAGAGRNAQRAVAPPRALPPPRSPPLLEAAAGMDAAAARLTAAALAAENRELRIQAKEVRAYRDLRGLFSKWHREAKAEGLDQLDIRVDELEKRGARITPDLFPGDGEDVTAQAERLKSVVAKRLAREIAEAITQREEAP